MEEEPGTAPSLRQSNRLRVIQALQVLGVTSRADVARYTRLSRSTVSTIVAALQAEGIVVDRDPDGRPDAQAVAARRRRSPSIPRPVSRSGWTSASATSRSRSPTSPTSSSPRSGARCRTTTTPPPGSSARPSWSISSWEPWARTAGECSALGWAFLGRCIAAAWSARRPSCRAGPGRAAERMSDRLGMEVWLRTTRTSERSQRRPGAPAAPPPRWSTSSWRRESAPGS